MPTLHRSRINWHNLRGYSMRKCSGVIELGASLTSEVIEVETILMLQGSQKLTQTDAK